MSDDVNRGPELLQQAPERLLDRDDCLDAPCGRGFAKTAELQGISETLLPMHEQSLAGDGLAAPFRAHEKSICHRSWQPFAPLVVAKAGLELAKLQFAEAEIIMSLGVVGPQCDRLAVSRGCFFQPLLILQRGAEILVRFRIVGPQ